MMKRKVNLDYKFVFVINKDLGMSKGKIASQICHVSFQLADVYQGVLGRVIVLKAEERILKNLCKDKRVMFIEDAGLTEVPAGSLTCVGFLANQELEKITRGLKLV